MCGASGTYVKVFEPFDEEGPRKEGGDNVVCLVWRRVCGPEDGGLVPLVDGDGPGLDSERVFGNVAAVCRELNVYFVDHAEDAETGVGG